MASFLARDPGKNQLFPPHRQLVFLQCIVKITPPPLCFCKLLIVNCFERDGMAVGWKMTRQKILFFLLIPLAFHFHPFSRHSSGRDVVSRATGSGIVACENSVKPETPRLNRIVCKQLYVNTLQETYQKSFFPAKSTWMPLGTRIICRIPIKHYNTMNYVDVSKSSCSRFCKNYTPTKIRWSIFSGSYYKLILLFNVNYYIKFSGF